MTQMTLQTAEKSWAEILQRALAGEEVIIERDGKPVAKVSPYRTEEDWFGMDEAKAGLPTISMKRLNNFPKL